jgi:hypothetical protein
MDAVEAIRHRNLLALVQDAGSQRAFADRVGKAPAQISQWATRAPHASTGRRRVISGDSARQIESACGLPSGWMDHDHTRETSATPLAQAVPIPPEYSTPGLDSRLLQIALETMEQVLQELGRTGTSEAKAEITMVAYEALLEGQARDAVARLISRTLRAIGGTQTTTT